MTASPPPTPSAGSGRPNLLFVTADQQKATSLGLYGNPDVRTPALEELAGRGALYRWAYTPHPLCVPTRVSLWTGRYPHQHGSRSNEILMPGGERHAGHLLKEAGYTLALIGKNHCFRPPDLALFDHVYLAGHTGPIGGETEPGEGHPRLPYLRARECDGRLTMVRTGRWKYVYDPGDPVDELYDLEVDPWELENLAPHPEHAPTVVDMRRRLLDWSLRTQDPRPVPLYYDLQTFQPSDDSRVHEERV